MKVLCLVGVLFALGVIQVESVPSPSQPVYIEDARQVSGRIVGGWEAVDGQIPYQVNVRMVNAAGSMASCGGSVIHNNWVMTAAHCLANRILFIVRFGVLNVNQPDLIVESNRKYIHPRYIEASAGVQTDDIALIGFDDPIAYTPRIQPCRLQNSAQRNINYDGVRLVVSGFGRTDDLWNGGAASNDLLWVFLRGMSNAECLTFYPNSQVIREQTICAGYYNHTSQSSCQGDSGGPLTVVDEDGIPTMVGVVSFGSSAGCNSRFPSGYVRPGHYHDWYTEVTGGLNFDWGNDD